MSFEAIVDDVRRTTKDEHPMIAIAYHEPMAQVIVYVEWAKKNGPL